MNQRIQTSGVMDDDKLALRLFINEHKTARLVEQAMSMLSELEPAMYKIVSRRADDFRYVTGHKQAAAPVDLSSFLTESITCTKIVEAGKSCLFVNPIVYKTVSRVENLDLKEGLRQSVAPLDLSSF